MDDPDALSSPQPLAAGEEPSPQELLELIRTQHEGAARDLYVDPARILVSWGVAWGGAFRASFFSPFPAPGHFLALGARPGTSTSTRHGSSSAGVWRGRSASAPSTSPHPAPGGTSCRSGRRPKPFPAPRLSPGRGCYPQWS